MPVFVGVYWMVVPSPIITPVVLAVPVGLLGRKLAGAAMLAIEARIVA
jgi:hypothetical protein